MTFCNKRLAKDQNNAPEAKKCLSFGDARSSVSQSTPAAQAGRVQVPSKIAPSAVVSSGICVSPIAFGVLGPTPILAPVFVPPKPQNIVN